MAIRATLMAISTMAALGLYTAPLDAQRAAARAAATPELSASVEATVRQVEPAVVEIFTTSYTPGDAAVTRTADLVTAQRASGSGVIVDPAGYIVTNAHVVRGAARLRVELPAPASGRSILAPRSRTVPAEIVGIDQETDLAVLRIPESNLPALPFADSDALRAGQVVIAFGSPMGFHNSVSLGVVSSVARQLEPDSPMIYVQTDAAINPGSSGGPLVDLRGRLVGLNTLIVSKAGGSEGLGFAAPSNIVRTIYEQIRATGAVRRGDIGVRTQSLTPELAAGLGLSRTTGAVVADVDHGSSAWRAGLRPGDVIAAVDGKPIENGRQAQLAFYRRAQGEIATLDVVRGGETRQMRVLVLNREDAATDAGDVVDAREHLVARLGILGLDLHPRALRLLPVARATSGVVVASTVRGAVEGPQGGLLQGDIVVAVNRTAVASLPELRAAVDALRTGDPVVLQIERRGTLMYLAFTID